MIIMSMMYQNIDNTSTCNGKIDVIIEWINLHSSDKEVTNTENPVYDSVSSMYWHDYNNSNVHL